MSNIKISELAEATEVNENDLLMIIQNGENKKIKASKVGTGQTSGGDTFPIGAIVPFAGDTIPNGWLLCDGSVVSRTTYSELFNAIGLTYVEDGYEWLDEERFPLPNPKGKVIVGKDSTDTDFNKLGKTGGEKTHRHNFTIGQMFSYGAPVGDGFENSGAYKDSTSSFAGDTGNIATNNVSKNTALANSMNTNAQAAGKTSTGDTTLSSNLQPYLVTNYIIKAKNTVVVKGDVIQEEGTASETNVYSAVAVDNKLNDLKVIDISNKFTVNFKKTSFKALYYPQSKTIEIWFEINNISGQNWVNIITINDTLLKPFANNYQTCYASGGVTVPVRITKTSRIISILSDGTKDMASGFIKIPVEEV